MPMPTYVSVSPSIGINHALTHVDFNQFDFLFCCSVDVVRGSVNDRNLMTYHGEDSIVAEILIEDFKFYLCNAQQHLSSTISPSLRQQRGVNKYLHLSKEKRAQSNIPKN